MTIETDIVTLPSYWASALINDDCSGLDENETMRLQHATMQLAQNGWYVVNMVEDSERFTWSYNLYDTLSDRNGGDVADYIVHRVTHTLHTDNVQRPCIFWYNNEWLIEAEGTRTDLLQRPFIFYDRDLTPSQEFASAMDISQVRGIWWQCEQG